MVSPRYHTFVINSVEDCIPLFSPLSSLSFSFTGDDDDDDDDVEVVRDFYRDRKLRNEIWLDAGRYLRNRVVCYRELRHEWSINLRYGGTRWKNPSQICIIFDLSIKYSMKSYFSCFFSISPKGNTLR